MKRREFCQSFGCLALWWSAGGLAFRPGYSSDQKIEEEKMAEKIIRVEAKVISQKGTCALGHKVGDVVEFTETGVKGKICLHALYSMLPAVFAMMFEARFPWLSNPDVKTHACPDAANPVVFEITRIREK